jgi:hypothetical protein
MMGIRFGVSFSDRPDFVTNCVSGRRRDIWLQHFRELTRGFSYIGGMSPGSIL